MSKGLEATKRLKWGYAITHDERIYLCECIEKELKEHEQYKAIEKELGIDLKIILKVIMTMKVWVIQNSRIRRFYVTNIVSYKKILKGYLTFGDTHNGWSTEEEIKFENYGKTWALTKEELEK